MSGLHVRHFQLTTHNRIGHGEFLASKKFDPTQGRLASHIPHPLSLTCLYKTFVLVFFPPLRLQVIVLSLLHPITANLTSSIDIYLLKLVLFSLSSRSLSSPSPFPLPVLFSSPSALISLLSSLLVSSPFLSLPYPLSSHLSSPSLFSPSPLRFSPLLAPATSHISSPNYYQLALFYL